MSQSGDASPIRVLLVDDDEDQRLLLRRLFAREGIEDVVEASNGREALGIVHQITPTIVVLDLAMPVMSGMDVLPALIEASPDSRVVVLSNMSREGIADDVRRRGALGFVEKRVPADRIISEILLAAAVTSITADRLSVARFPVDRSTPRLARRFVRELLSDAGEELVATVELLVSELATNAVIHAASAPHISVRVSERRVRVEVYDDDPMLPTAREPAPDAPGGRGLVLLGALASRWDIRVEGSGKTVWFELDR
ncbi:MAG TPA: response regulator [Acidimicrobiales bacterium]